MKVPDEVVERISSLRLPSFWAAPDGTRWVAVAVGFADARLVGHEGTAPAGTCAAHVCDLGFTVERPTVDEAVLAMVDLLAAHVRERGAEIPRASYALDLEGPGSLCLTTEKWLTSVAASARLGLLFFGAYVAVRVTAVDGEFVLEPSRKD